MLDIKLIRENPDKINELLKRRNPELSIDEVIEIDVERRKIQTQADELRAKRKSESQKIGELKKKGENTDAIQEDVRKIGDEIKALEEKGFEVLQGKGSVQGRLLGGCIDVMANLMGTSVWPKAEEWKDKILFVETSDNNMSPSSLAGILRSFASQGIFDKVKGVIVGKPAHEDFYEEYKKVYKDVIGFEAKRPDLPIIYNVNFGHATPITIIPYGIKCKIDCKKKSITITEKCVKN